MATTLGALNPFRYRGYVYDEETSLYYLRSRYYNPDWGRFINADSVLGKPGQLLGHNVFTYCKNNPLLLKDDDGKFALLFTIFVGVLGGVVSSGTQIIYNLASGKQWHEDLAGAFAGGFVYNTTALTGNIAAAGYAASAAESFTNEVVDYVFSGKELTTSNVLQSIESINEDFIINGSLYTATGYFAKNLVKVNSGWIRPQKLASVLFGNYSRAVAKQTTAQGFIVGLINLAFFKLIVSESGTK